MRVPVELVLILPYPARVIALIDYGAGNLHSVEKALRFLGADVKRVARPEQLKDARAAVLPGVGAFDDCLQAMQKQELLEGSREYVKTGRPFLGICVGYQALFERSEEFNSCAAGLGLFKGKVVRFSGRDGVKVPQIGWNQVEFTRKSKLLKRIADKHFFYFVHSYYADPLDRSRVLGKTNYGISFASILEQEPVFAVQFHPEKSQAAGLQLLKNFITY